MRFIERNLRLSALGTLLAIAAGCSAPTNPPTPSPSAEGAAYRLTVEPAGAQEVKAARDAVKDGEQVALVGRIGGDVNPWVEGQAAFLLVDNELKPCNEKGDDSCTTPWDYCCDTDQLLTHKAMIKVVDSSGKTVPTDARRLLGVKELQTIVVAGRAKIDDAGNLTVLADGVFVRN